MTNEGKETVPIELPNGQMPFFIKLFDASGKERWMTEAGTRRVRNQEPEAAMLSMRGQEIAPGDILFERYSLWELFPNGLQPGGQLVICWVPEGIRLKGAVATTRITLPDRPLQLKPEPVLLGHNLILGKSRPWPLWLRSLGWFVGGVLTASLFLGILRRGARQTEAVIPKEE